MPDNTLEAKWQEAIKQLHGLAASLADSKQRYDATGDKRYLTAVANVLPIFRQWMQTANDIARQLGGKEMPSSLMLSLSSTSDWLIARGKDVGEGVTGVVAGVGDAAQSIGKDAASVTRWLIAGAIVVAGAYALGQLGPLVKVAKTAVK